MRFSAGTLARCVLFAMLLVVPLVFTSATLEAFETPKVAILQLGGAALLALGLMAYRRTTMFREPIPIAACGFVLSALISTLISISPRTSFLGGIESFAGLTTVLSYFVVLAAVRLFVADEAQVQRLLLAPSSPRHCCVLRNCAGVATRSVSLGAIVIGRRLPTPVLDPRARQHTWRVFSHGGADCRVLHFTTDRN